MYLTLPRVLLHISSPPKLVSDLALAVKSEPILGSEGFGFANRDLSLVCIKTEDPESDSFENPSLIPFVDVVEPSIDTEIPDEVLEGHVHENQELVLYGDGYREYFPDPSEDIEIDGCDSVRQVLCIDECRNCALNEVFCDHLKPISLLEVSAGDTLYVSDKMMSCQPCVDSTPESDTNDMSDNVFSGSSREFITPHKDQSCHVTGSLNDSHVLIETSRHSSRSSGIQAPDTAVNTEVERIDFLTTATQTGPFSSQELVAALESLPCPSLEDKSVSTDNGTAERDQSRASSSVDATQDCWKSINHFTSGSPTTSEKEPPEMVSISSNRGSSSRTATSLDHDSLSAPVFQNPGRLTRKIVPPNSRERLCLTRNCEEFHNDGEEYTCKEKLFLGEKNNSNPSIEIPNIETARRADNTAHPGKVNRIKVVTNPSQILQKEKNQKRGSPPKGNLEQPDYSRSLPCINSGCTSVKSCSKGVIAFSQRQMHDFDSLAGKLLNELKSMKDIVEQKLLLNPCRNLSLRNDADEVVAAIKTATRVEENTKRLISVMTRDCNRFCKIMSLTQDGPSSNINEIPRESRKMVFADEAGEMLCHVKFFENGSTSMGPLAEKSDNQNGNALN